MDNLQIVYMIYVNQRIFASFSHFILRIRIYSNTLNRVYNPYTLPREMLMQMHRFDVRREYQTNFISSYSTFEECVLW